MFNLKSEESIKQLKQELHEEKLWLIKQLDEPYMQHICSDCHTD